MERFLRRPRSGAALQVVPEPEPETTFESQEPRPEADGLDAAGGSSVEVIHGVTRLAVPLAGMTVTEAFELMRHALHLPEDVMALVDGSQAEGDTRLEGRSSLEFVRYAGEKGADA